MQKIWANIVGELVGNVGKIGMKNQVKLVGNLGEIWGNQYGKQGKFSGNYVKLWVEIMEKFG